MVWITKGTAKALVFGGMMGMLGTLGYSCHGAAKASKLYESPVVKQMQTYEKNADTLEKKLALCVPTGDGAVTPDCVGSRVEYGSLLEKKEDIQDEFDTTVEQIEAYGQRGPDSFKWVFMFFIASIIGSGPYQRYKRQAFLEKQQKDRMDDFRGK